MKTKLFLLEEREKDLIIQVIKKVNENFNCNCKVEFEKSKNGTFATIQTEGTEVIMYIGIYLGRNGF